MANIVEGPTRTYIATAAIGLHERVKLVAGEVVVALLADSNWIGTTETQTFAVDKPVAVRLRSAEGTKKMVALVALAQGVNVFTAAAGKVSTTATGAFHIGIVMGAEATADGDFIEVLETPNPVVES